MHGYFKTVFICSTLCALFFAAGCSSTRSYFSPSDDSAPEPAPAGATLDAASGHYYWEFDDILVPKELDHDDTNSFILDIPNVRAGVMFFDGRVDRLSLTDFFLKTMAERSWRIISAFKSVRTVLVFEKENRYSIIRIIDETTTTPVQIWVYQRELSGLPRGEAPPVAPSFENPAPLETPDTFGTTPTNGSMGEQPLSQ